ncbi:hypothetical protein RRG08_001527 [Elysia crispata]|uniref:Uncharacterized protein n=1 Tax=Elysia crispata TaxID=231223 RepID=A0AAE1A9T1_9GAST|nr:hypothetical protein RRG08_001527 [Elysia crispata]
MGVVMRTSWKKNEVTGSSKKTRSVFSNSSNFENKRQCLARWNLRAIKRQPMVAPNTRPWQARYVPVPGLPAFPSPPLKCWIPRAVRTTHQSSCFACQSNSSVHLAPSRGGIMRAIIAWPTG